MPGNSELWSFLKSLPCSEEKNISLPSHCSAAAEELFDGTLGQRRFSPDI